MTDEKFVALETMKERSDIAKGIHYRGKSKGVTLPSDTLSRKDIKDKSGHVIFYSMDRPMSFEKFTNLGEDIQKDYIQRLISVYGGDTGKISKMFGIAEARVKKLREELDISSRCSASESEENAEKWKEFLEKGDYLSKPMTWENFKRMDWYDQTQYIQFLIDVMGASMHRISSELFGNADLDLGGYLRRKSIPDNHKGKGYRMSKEQTEAWMKWLSDRRYMISESNKAFLDQKQTYINECLKDVGVITIGEIYDILGVPESITRPEGTITEKPITEEPIVTQPVIFENLEVTIKVSSFEDLAEKIKTLPLSKHGVIRFDMEEA